MTISLRARGIAAVVLDIEGTTTPIAFVHDVLFSYARVHLRGHLRSTAGTPGARTIERALRQEHGADVLAGTAAPPLVDIPQTSALESVATYVEWLMDSDRKSSALKELQGTIWKSGYEEGTLKGAVFADVPRAFERWQDAGMRIAIFSSGSERSQRMLFSSTIFGDLTAAISAYFDTATGPKSETASYAQIAASLDIGAANILFVSDVVDELSAAAGAGMQCVLMVRPGNPDPHAGAFPIVRSFDEFE